MRWLILSSVLATLAAGCGEKGPARYPVSGKVTYQGKPLGSGHITFEPDSRSGNKGPSRGCKISQGEYRLTGNDAPIGGPHLIRITPPPLQSGASIPVDHPKFTAAEFRRNLKESKSTEDFVVDEGLVTPDSGAVKKGNSIKSY